jgi:hypothetical protein
MNYNHTAIFKAYPQVTYIKGDEAFDADGSQVTLDPGLIAAKTVEVETAEARSAIERSRIAAYQLEADPLFFKAQRGEATTDEWTAKVAEIKARFPYPGADQ